MTREQRRAATHSRPRPGTPLDRLNDWEGFRLDPLPASDALCEVSGAISTTLGEKPVRAAMLSLACGALVGFWIGRRFS